MNTEIIKFKGGEGNELSATLELPEKSAPLAFAVFAHCFTCTRNLPAVKNITQAMNRQGIAVLSFDFTGLGGSEGDFSDTNFSTNVSDLVAAAEFLNEKFAAPEILVGHSLGGAAVLAAAHSIESIKAVATIGAPADPEHVAKHFEGDRDTIEKEGSAKVNIGGRPFLVKKQFLADIESVKMQGYVGDLKRALLIMHSPTDNIVGIENAQRIFEAAKHPKSFVALDGAGHLLGNKADAIFAGTVISAWAKRFIHQKQKDEDLLRPESQVLVRTGAGLTTSVKTPRHSLVADEPIEVGGSDYGPTPYNYLLTALGTCTSMTLRMYADRKKWNLDEVRVHLDHDKIHASDCKDCETKDGKLDLISRKIELHGDLSAEERARLLEIADKCPVHRTLSSEIKINTTEKPV